MTNDHTEATQRVLGELYDHLLSHPFFDKTIRKVLGISETEDVTENESYWRLKTQLIDQALKGLIGLNGFTPNQLS